MSGRWAIGLGRRMVNVIASQTKREAERSTGTIDGRTDGQSSHDRAAMTKKKNIL